MTNTRRAGLLLPALLIAAGLVVILVNAGFSTPGGWERLAEVWPLALVLIGLELVTTAAGAPLRAVAVFAILGVLVVAGAYVVAGPAQSPAVLTGALSGPATANATSAELKIVLDGGSVRLTSGDTGGLLYTAGYSYPASAVDQKVDEAGVHVVTFHRQWPGVFTSPRSSSVDVTLDPAVRWQVEIDAAGVETNADLTGATAVTGFKGAVAGGHFDLRLPPPSGEARIEISGVGTSTTVRLPSGSEAQARVSGVGANFTGPAGAGAVAMGERTWATPGFAGASDRYVIAVSGVGANLQLEVS
jgi:hypothetical protein